MRFEHGRGGVLAGAGIGVAELCRLADCVKAFEVAVCTPEIIAGDGDFGIAHAVTDEQDDVLGGAVADGRNALCAAVLSQFRNGLAVQIVSGSFVGERRCRKRAERCNGSDCCNRSFESLSIAHLFSSVFSLCCIAISTPGFANQLPRRFGRTKRELSSSQSEHLSQILFPSTTIPNTP